MSKIFAVFWGVFTRWATPLGVRVGVTSGILLNLYLWLGVPQLSWLWWNAIGMLVAVLTAYVISRALPVEAVAVQLDPPEPPRINWPLQYALIVVYFFAIVGFCAWIQLNALA